MRITLSSKRSRQGTATFVVLALTVIISVLISSNSRAIRFLETQMRQVERQQQKHWDGAAAKDGRKPAAK